MLRCGGKGAGRRLLQQFLLPAAESTAAAEVACQQLRFFRQTASSNVQAAVAGRSFQNAGARSACSRGFAAAAAESGPAKRGPVSVLSLALTAATGGGLLWYYNHMMQEKLQQAVIKQESAGKPRIGGPFQLVDQNGNAFSDRDLVGKWALLYFGFTFCPDICPDELDKMVAAIDSIEKGCGEAVQPVFISLDPARDTVPQMRRYCAEFHPRLIGLTGSVEQVQRTLCELPASMQSCIPLTLPEASIVIM